MSKYLAKAYKFINNVLGTKNISHKKLGKVLLNSYNDWTTGQYHYPNMQYAGPGTRTEIKIQKGVKPSNYEDEVALHHDLDYGEIKNSKKSDKQKRKDIIKADQEFLDRYNASSDRDKLYNRIPAYAIQAKQFAQKGGLIDSLKWLGN
jgi:hypothetical protein